MLTDFELLCADGRRAALSEWESCNLGMIPPNTIMTRAVLTPRVYDFLMKSQVSLCDHTVLVFLHVLIIFRHIFSMFSFGTHWHQQNNHCGQDMGMLLKLCSPKFKLFLI